MKTRRNSGSKIPRLRLDIHTTPQSLSGPVTSMARTMPTIPPRFVRPYVKLSVSVLPRNMGSELQIAYYL